MSLLIDALRKAEANRQQTGGGNATTAAEVAEALTLQPIDLDSADLPPPAAATSHHIPASSAPTGGRQRLPTPSATAAADEAARRNARQLFGAKPVQRTSPAWWAAGIGALIAAAGGSYVWWQTQPRSLGVMTSPAHALAAPDTGRSPPLLGPDATPPGPPGPADEVAVNPPVASASTPVVARKSVVHAQRPVAAETSPEAGVKVRTGSAGPRSAASTAIDMAYGAYERGELPLARALYQEALRADPRSPDALNGLAATALRQGQSGEAERLFKRALQNNPQDDVARAGVLSLGHEADPMAAESRLKGAIAETPDAASNHFALGNLQAASGRWSDAQQSYFRAHTLESDNPDYLFNLAVSLDRINQPQLARQYYERALSAAAQRPAAFDKTAALRRAQALSTP